MPTPFTLIPAIDIKDGQCVRLKQGRMEETTVFADSPLQAAEHWNQLGTQRLHLVDLDGAFAGQPVNHQIVRQVCQKFPHLKVQVGGGNRCLTDLEMLFDFGVSYCILGTSAVKNPDFIEQATSKFPYQIMLGIDAKNGYVATEGWASKSSLKAAELAQQFAELPIKEIIYTDIARDGMLSGVNLQSTCELAEHSAFPIIASGGARSIADIRDLLQTPQCQNHKIVGLIAGRAIYTGDLDFSSAQTYITEFKYPS